MKNRILTITALLIVLLQYSCNNENDNSIGVRTTVTFDVGVEQASSSQDFTKTGTYERGTAPINITGINIDATNTTYSVFVPEYFDFADEGTIGLPITMELMAGTNEFYAKTTTSEPSLWTSDDTFKRITSMDDIQQRAAAYSDTLKKYYSTHAVYECSTTRDIVLEGNNYVPLNMEATNGRINFVLEAEEEQDVNNCNIEVQVYVKDDAGQEVELETFGTVAHTFNSANVIACMVNKPEMTEGSYMLVKIQYKNEYVTGDSGIKILTQPGKNITYLVTHDYVLDAATTSFGFDVEDFQVVTGINHITN